MTELARKEFDHILRDYQASEERDTLLPNYVASLRAQLEGAQKQLDESLIATVLKVSKQMRLDAESQLADAQARVKELGEVISKQQFSIEHLSQQHTLQANKAVTLTAALGAERQRVLNEVAEAWDRMTHAELAKHFPSMDLYPKWGNIFAAWCRRQGSPLAPPPGEEG